MLNIQNKKIILASKSPRRHELLKGMGIEYSVLVKEVDEVFPLHLKADEIALYLSKLKSDVFTDSDIDEDTIVITADTIVWIKDTCLGKPVDVEDARSILKLLSANKHTVYTGVCLRDKYKQKSFCVKTDVYFKALTESEIEYYINTYKPFDKAGSYGVQEWIGFVAIDRIEGSFYNVMGLPTKELYEELILFAE